MLQDRQFKLLASPVEVVSIQDSWRHATHKTIAEDDPRGASKYKVKRGGVPYGLVESFCKAAERRASDRPAEILVVCLTTLSHSLVCMCGNVMLAMHISI